MSLSRADEIKPIVLGQDLYAELFGLFELRSRARAGHNVKRILGHRARHLRAEPFSLRFCLVARQPFELAGEYDGRTRELRGHHAGLVGFDGQLALKGREDFTIVRLSKKSTMDCATASPMPSISFKRSNAPVSAITRRTSSSDPNVFARSFAVVSPTWRMPRANMNLSSAIVRRASMAAKRFDADCGPHASFSASFGSETPSRACSVKISAGARMRPSSKNA